jgi:hypothetical protein
MKKTSLYIEDELDTALARRAAEEGITKAELIRRTLAGTVMRPKRAKPKAVGVIKRAPADLASNLDRYLADSDVGEWR